MGHLSSTHQACEMEANSSFGDLTLRFFREDDMIEKIELSSTNSKFKMYYSNKLSLAARQEQSWPISLMCKRNSDRFDLFASIARDRD